MTDHLLGGFSPASQAEAKVELAQRGVEVRLGVAIAVGRRRPGASSPTAP